MNVLLINPPSPFLLNPMTFPPLGLLYLAAALERYGHTAHVWDMNSKATPRFSPDLIGITSLTPHIPKLKRIVPQLKAQFVGVPIILGGPHFSNRSTDAFTLGADAVCIGDGEEAIEAALFGGRGTMNGFIDVDAWPMPARHLLDLHAYSYKVGGKPATSIVTARGCAYSCAYCSRGPGNDLLRNRAIPLVAKEVEAIKALGFEGLQIYDDEVNISTRRLLELCEALQGAQVKWRCFVRANLFTIEQARAMSEAGCVEVCCGVESGSEAILKSMDKKATVAEASRARIFASYYGMRFKAFCMIGLPGETEETVLLTKQWLLDMKPDDFDLCPFTPYPGSLVGDHPERYDIQIESGYWDEPIYHKGVLGQYRVTTRTSTLSAQRIAELHDSIETEVRERLGLGRLV